MKGAATANCLAPLADAAGKWRTRDDVRIFYLDRKGPLTAGFGWVMGEAMKRLNVM